MINESSTPQKGKKKEKMKDVRWNEASGRYSDARTTALYRNHNPHRFETIVGRHAVKLVDYAQARQQGNNEQSARLAQELDTIISRWAEEAALTGHPITPETSALDEWKDEHIDRQFRGQVLQKINEFHTIAMSAIRGVSVDFDAQGCGVEVYKYLSHRGARDYHATLRHFQQYVVYLRRLGATHDTASVEFLEIATAVILCGLNVGAYIDSVL